MKQQTFSDLEYANRREKTRRESFLDTMNGLIPWEEWLDFIRPYYYSGRKGRKPKDPEAMLRMYLLQKWFSLSDTGTEEAVSDSYAMRSFLGINFMEEQTPDATTLRRFRHFMKKYGLEEKIEEELSGILAEHRASIKPGSIVNPRIIRRTAAKAGTEDAAM